jgi:acyl-coenzyme A thioesterase PaaI-like protein
MSVHESWLVSLEKTKAQLNAQGIDIQLPPPSQQELQIEYLEVIPGKKIKGKIPFQTRFTNPIKTYQGGILTAAIDDHFGPLSYITAERPCTTLSLNTTFLKPFTEKMGFCIIEAEVLQKTKAFIFMRAVVMSPEGDLLAHAESHVAILRDDQLQKVNA